MLGAILAFIKAHIVATVITTTVVVTTAVATPIAVDNYTLNKTVEENIGLLVQNENPTTDTTEPLTFRIEKKDLSNEGGTIVKNMQGEDAILMEGSGSAYNIIPSYNKDVSEWTKAEKKEFEKAIEEIRAKAKENYDNAVASEQNSMAEALQNLEKEMESYSEYYIIHCLGTAEYQYNYYTKRYYGYFEDYGVKQHEKGGITAEDFKNIVYPTMLQKIETLYETRIEENQKLNSSAPPTVMEELIKEIERDKQYNLKILNDLLALSSTTQG